MSKDWNGGYNSVFKTLGAHNNCTEEREINDYYATEPKAIDKLLEVYKLPHYIWEPACGEGHLSKRVEELGHQVYSSDLIERGFGISGVDFLQQQTMSGIECILTNPPYKYATEFVLHAIDLLPTNGICAMFLKTSFLEGKKRRDSLFRVYPPHYIFQFSERMVCAKNGDFAKMAKIGSAVAYAWYVWEKGYNGDTIVRWI